jgi:CRP-like cAMP-binding protein
MRNPLILKLDHLCGMDPADHGLLEFGPARNVPLHHDIAREGSEVSHTTLLLSGIACRYKMMGDGRRAIVGFLVPGDFTSLLFPDRQKLDFGVAALTPCEVIDVPCATLREITRQSPWLTNALWCCAQMDQAIQRTWLANISQCAADKRMAHLLCELRLRLALVELAGPESFRLSITQQELADALGLSTVHVNRVLQHLKERDLIRVMDRTVFIPDLNRLEGFADFDPGYLYPQKSGDPAKVFPGAALGTQAGNAAPSPA